MPVLGPPGMPGVPVPCNRNDVDIEFETKAFEICDKDGDEALDWQEVENCEKEYGAYVNLKELPDENDFKYFDTNKDGKLLFDEWLSQFNKQTNN